jgi:type VI secretion system protein ImpE
VTSSAEALFRVGHLAESLGELQKEIRSRPADGRLRVFLAQLLMLAGEWDRAINQLNVAGELDSASLPLMYMYSAAIQCERVREAVFRGERTPLVFGEPEPWIAQLIQSLSLQTQGRTEEAAVMRAQALETAPATAGSLNGSAFDWIADADSRLGPVLEVVLNGTYYWVPFSRIRRVVTEPPEDARDLVWLPAELTWTNEGQATGLIPVRYSGSERSADNSILLSRRTEWREIADHAFAGTGQRVLTTSTDEVGILEVREIELQSDPSWPS